MREYINIVESAQPMSPARIDAAIKAVAKRHDGFGGNCARFAVVLNKVLGGGGTYVYADTGDHYEYVDHVALEFQGHFYDASGLIDRDDLEEWATNDDGEVGDIEEVDEQTALKLVDESGAGFSAPLNIERLARDLRKALGG